MTSRTALHVIQGHVIGQYCRGNMLAAHVVSFARRHGRRIIFQDDNASRVHRARVEFPQEQNITTLPWPVLSPDLSPIEHIWDMLGRRRQRQQPPTNVQELAAALQEEWNNISQADVGEEYATSDPR